MELRDKIGGLLYGCDICQDVCPWNIRFSRSLGQESTFRPRAVLGDDVRALARGVLAMTPAEFSTAFKNSPMKRAKLRGLKRNAAVVLGNVGTSDDLSALTTALDDVEPVVREHAAWALARLRASDQSKTSVEPQAND
jgi:epoxyqueuosine reductase